MTLHQRIENLINRERNTAARVIETRPAGSGINDCMIIRLDDGADYFVKTRRGPLPPDTFRIEFESLVLLREPGVIDVPEPLGWEEDFLVMERLKEGARASDWEERMGRSLALLQRGCRREAYGFHCDNYLGTTKQINTWHPDWLTFWREERLGFQLRLFAAGNGGNDPLLAAGDSLLARLDGLLGGVREAAVLLHGDLWSGNAAANEKGMPVIFDPACYYGHREAEFGMMRLFGGFGPRVEAAYAEVWPFEEGFEERCRLYRLYHELNHLNLFGAAYYPACMRTLKSLL